MRRSLVAFVVGLAFVLCAPVHGTTVTILNTGDIHERSGNLARIAHYVKQIKEEDPNVLFVDAGDWFNKGELELMATRGKAIGDIMSTCGYDARVLGNHDFSFGTERLSHLVDELSFPLLGANLTWPPGLAPRNFAAYKLFPLQGATVAVIGCAYEGRSNHCADTDLVPARIEDSIRELVPELRKRADIIVLIIHASDARDLQVARAVPGIDVIISGHSHHAFEQMHYDPESETIIHKAGAYGSFIGQVVLEWDGESIAGRSARLIEITQDMPEEPTTKAVQDACFAAFRANDPVLEAPAEMTPPDIVEWLTQAAARRVGARFVIVRPGDFARSLPAGPVSARALLRAVPRQGLVCFSVADAAAAAAVRAALREADPELRVIRVAEPTPGPIIFLDLRWRYDVPFDRKRAGLAEAPIADLRRDPDASLWQVALEAARARRDVGAPRPATVGFGAP